jgi:hypothetical protein
MTAAAIMALLGRYLLIAAIFPWVMAFGILYLSAALGAILLGLVGQLERYLYARWTGRA